MWDTRFLLIISLGYRIESLMLSVSSNSSNEPQTEIIDNTTVPLIDDDDFYNTSCTRFQASQRPIFIDSATCPDLDSYGAYLPLIYVIPPFDQEFVVKKLAPPYNTNCVLNFTILVDDCEIVYDLMDEVEQGKDRSFRIYIDDLHQQLKLEFNNTQTISNSCRQTYDWKYFANITLLGFAKEEDSDCLFEFFRNGVGYYNPKPFVDTKEDDDPYFAAENKLLEEDFNEESREICMLSIALCITFFVLTNNLKRDLENNQLASLCTELRTPSMMGSLSSVRTAVMKVDSENGMMVQVMDPQQMTPELSEGTISQKESLEMDTESEKGFSSKKRSKESKKSKKEKKKKEKSMKSKKKKDRSEKSKKKRNEGSKKSKKSKDKKDQKKKKEKEKDGSVKDVSYKDWQ
ncbi:unnamed protein product [Bursaphelenchus xylophilus]|uniref:(pine wood nematode) hypothetical protein n=1 Tax=Bursaphelenchus xylophilus TaxID=6326 RepID=A0A7I8XAZ3_BURXY|nr:unnamed protein product [Bursaphelenchus xylophilus]CAG9082805.1 unnamed protein product [Bursaphelenchus xylophilus]